MKLQIFSFILLTVGTPVENLITCNVPDGKPSSIPQDCQVCLDTIVVTNDKSTWPAKELALQKIETLSIQADLPRFLQIPLQVETLEIRGDISNGTEFPTISAENLFLDKLRRKTIIFKDIKPIVLKISNSEVAIYGIVSEYLQLLSIDQSTITDTVLRDLTSTDIINIAHSTISPQYLLPKLNETHSINIHHSSIAQVNFPVAKVTGNINIEENRYISSIEFHNLETVLGDLLIENFREIPTIKLPHLQQIHAIEVHAKTIAIDLPSSVKWTGKAYFENTTSLENYAHLRAQGLGFGVGIQYKTRCFDKLEI
ncbi:hypothetical protein DSO57_1008271 [Entomophthora muscae]|uniref:Uncharacterized protein n=1 Tax=Entomophthora muscae TaxID=34485 RepID=A0ACC2UI33_9FUNG|nr:hypothetical protein DSO57_1008271 [Entomophthora muscae]